LISFAKEVRICSSAHLGNFRCPSENLRGQAQIKMNMWTYCLKKKKVVPSKLLKHEKFSFFLRSVTQAVCVLYAA
jgi:hypothetical protein